MVKGYRCKVNDRPVTLILVAVAILVALYIRRTKGVTPAAISSPELLSPLQMKREGEVRGIKVDMSQPMTREQFERILGPVSVK